MKTGGNLAGFMYMPLMTDRAKCVKKDRNTLSGRAAGRVNMSLYAIGDLHLHFQSELRSEAQRNGRVWKDHENRFREICAGLIHEDDTLVLVGDHSWGGKLSKCEQDLQYICDLPGRKILLRGNHDHFWDVKKTEKLNELYRGKLEFLQNSFASYREYALVGTKGYTFEGPFYVTRTGRITGWDEDAAAEAERLVEREYERLQISFDAAVQAGYSKFIMFLHYPPTNVLQKSSCFTKIAEKYRVEQVIYAHCHGESRFHDSILGGKNGVRYSLVSGDYLRWHPMKVLD